MKKNTLYLKYHRGKVDRMGRKKEGLKNARKT